MNDAEPTVTHGTKQRPRRDAGPGYTRWDSYNRGRKRKDTMVITYTLFIPMIFLTFNLHLPTPKPTPTPTPAPRVSGLKGVALVEWIMSDITLLNASWYHGWGENCGTDTRCVNMVREMQLPGACYQTLLVGNEPNWEEPAGHPVTPTLAVMDVMAIQAMCPNTKLVVGNVAGYVPPPNLLGADWIKQFLSEYKRLSGHDFSGAIGVHCYTNTFGPYFCENGGWGYDAPLKTMRAAYSGEMWVSEWNCLQCAINDFGQMMGFIAMNFDRYSVYTNRQPQQGYIDGWALAGADLVNPDGTLTPNGYEFANSNP